MRSLRRVGFLQRLSGGGRPPNVLSDAEYNLPRVLIQAGRRAWELYGEASGDHVLDEDVAVGLLVGLAKEGMTEEGLLVAAGLRYLVSLTMQTSPPISNDGADEGVCQPLRFCIDSANAKFLLQWRVPWIDLHRQKLR